MTVTVDHNAATSVLMRSLERVKTSPVDTCAISEQIDTVLGGSGCLTYQYVLLTALAARAANPSVDMLSLQVEDQSVGAYAPRTLCSNVVYPFQLKFLDNVLDGSNNDPLVNKPARYLRLDVSNAARGDGRRALNALCQGLPLVTTPEMIQECLDYMMTRLHLLADFKRQGRESAIQSVTHAAVTDVHSFLNDLLNQGFGGGALVLAATVLYRVQYPEASGFKVVPHPVNQSGASSRQLSDMDLTANGVPILGTELKDKVFTADDVRRAADTSLAGGLHSLIFIAGRNSGYTTQPPTYFNDLRATYLAKDMYIGLIGIDGFLDFVLANHLNMDSPAVLQSAIGVIDEISGSAEMQMWVYGRLDSLKNASLTAVATA